MGRVGDASPKPSTHLSPGPGNQAAKLPAWSHKSCSASASSLKQKYHPEHPSQWYFGMSCPGWKVEVETQGGLSPARDWTLKTTPKPPQLEVRLSNLKLSYPSSTSPIPAELPVDVQYVLL